MNKTLHIISVLCLTLTFASCEDGFLDKRPDKSLLIPATAGDFRALLNNINMNSAPGLPLVASDDFNTSDEGWTALLTPEERNSYIWADQIFESQVIGDWSRCFQQVLYANIVLEGLTAPVTKPIDKSEADVLRGSALFYRGVAYFNLLQTFAAPYTEANATGKPGLPLHLSANVNDRPARGTLRQTYDQVIKDLEESIGLLPATVAFKTRPSKPAAFALLARVYLQMKDYSGALVNAEQALQYNSFLLDYNTLSPTAARPFPIALPSANDEITYYMSLVNYSYFSAVPTKVNTEIINLYQPNDLRRVLFLNANSNFKGSYTGRTDFFGGIAVDELLLIKAECLARQGKTFDAMSVLNTLLQKRWKTGTFISLTALDAAEALTKILAERRKELLGRGLRWMDLRRLNTDQETQTTLKRQLNGKDYSLLPNDPKYVFPIPDVEISTGAMEQNER